MAGYHKGTHFQRSDPLQKKSVNRTTRHCVRKKRKTSQNAELQDLGSLDDQCSCMSFEVDKNLMGSTDKETEQAANDQSYPVNQDSSTQSTSVDAIASDCAPVRDFKSVDFEERLFVPLQDIPENYDDVIHRPFVEKDLDSHETDLCETSEQLASCVQAGLCM